MESTPPRTGDVWYDSATVECPVGSCTSFQLTYAWG